MDTFLKTILYKNNMTFLPFFIAGKQVKQFNKAAVNSIYAFIFIPIGIIIFLLLTPFKKFFFDASFLEAFLQNLSTAPMENPEQIEALLQQYMPYITPIFIFQFTWMVFSPLISGAALFIVNENLKEKKPTLRGFLKVFPNRWSWTILGGFLLSLSIWLLSALGNIFTMFSSLFLILPPLMHVFYGFSSHGIWQGMPLLESFRNSRKMIQERVITAIGYTLFFAIYGYGVLLLYLFIFTYISSYLMDFYIFIFLPIFLLGFIHLSRIHFTKTLWFLNWQHQMNMPSEKPLV